MYKRILVPTDGSEVSELALEAALEFARAFGSEIVALSVAQPYPIVPLSEGGIVADVGFEVDAPVEQAEKNVRRVADAAAAAGVKCATRTAFSHSPSDEILDAAKRNACDLIFMGSHGRRGLSRLLAGSVTQNVLAYSTVPVLVLRPHGLDRSEHATSSAPDAASTTPG
jgi:nucleotide-binding universal stress UspA family protein